MERLYANILYEYRNPSEYPHIPYISGN